MVRMPLHQVGKQLTLVLLCCYQKNTTHHDLLRQLPCGTPCILALFTTPYCKAKDDDQTPEPLAPHLTLWKGITFLCDQQSLCVDVLSLCDVVLPCCNSDTSLCGAVLSLCGAGLSLCGAVLSLCDEV